LLKEKEKRRGTHQLFRLRYMGSGLHAEIGCRKVYAWDVFE